LTGRTILVENAVKWKALNGESINSKQ